MLPTKRPNFPSNLHTSTKMQNIPQKANPPNVFYFHCVATGEQKLLSLQERLRATYACTANNVRTSLVEGRPVTFIIDEISVESDLSQTEDVDMVLLCFNIMSPPSLHNLYLHWLPRLSSLTTSSLLLVGCQADLRRDKAGLASLARTGSQPVSSNLALSFCRRMEAAMYVETEARLSNKSARAVFELAAKTCGGQLSRQSSIMSSSSSVTFPLLSQRSRSTRRDSSREFWSKLRSPSAARRGPTNLTPVREKENHRLFLPRRSQSAARVGGGGLDINPGNSRLARHFGRELNRCPAEKLVKIKCVRLTEDKSQEEIEIEVPESIYVNMSDDSEPGWSDVSEGWSRRIKGYFNKSDKY